MSSAYTERVLKTIAMVVAAGVAVAVVGFCIDIFLMIFAGALLALFFGQCAKALAPWLRLSYGWSLAVVLLIALVVVVGGFSLMGTVIAQQVSTLGEALSNASRDAYERFEQSLPSPALLKNLPQPEDLLRGRSGLFSALGTVLGGFFGALATLGLILVFGIYLAASPELYARGLERLMPPAFRPRTREVLLELADRLWWWIIGRLIDMTIIGVFSALGLWALGVPLPITLGVIAGLLTFIPNIGPLISVVPAALLALEQGPSIALAVIGYYAVLQTVESYYLTPHIDQRAVHVPPVVTLAAQLILGVMVGMLGIAVATPLVATLMVLARRLYIEPAESSADIRGKQDG